RPVFQQLYQQQDTWRAAPLWQENTVASAAAASLNDEELLVSPALAKRMDNPAGWLALVQGHEAAAKQQFDQQIIDNPYDGTAYLGRSIISYRQNDLEQAKTFVEQADLLGTKDAFWRNIIIEEMAFNELLSSYTAYSTFDISNARSTTYSRTVLLRSGLLYDVIPQLYCLSATPVLSQNFTALSPHLSLGERADLEAFMQGDRDGVRPCVTVKR
ncbi:MAG: hypothetical protein KDE51_00095, partial [Anaerolineales bacterium]|nr:hypothetical protein [Anaerolineales bacterium]